MKRCSKCGQMHSKEEFIAHTRSKDKLGYRCKNCRRMTPSRIQGTLERFKLSTWGNINRRTVNGLSPDYKSRSHMYYITKGIKVLFSREEFYKFCDDNKDKILGLYAQGKKPSIDRIDDDKHYTIDNIEIKDLYINVYKGSKKSGLVCSKPIRATNTKSREIKLYKSMADAEKFGFLHSNIVKCCKGERKSHHGYRFEYVDKKEFEQTTLEIDRHSEDPQK